MDELLNLMVELNTVVDPDVYDTYEFTCDGEYFMLVHNGSWVADRYMYYGDFVEWLKGYINNLQKEDE